MRIDRVIQAVSIVVVLVAMVFAGRMLPGIVESAGEPVVLVRVGEDDPRLERIPVSEIRALVTATPAARPGRPMALSFDSGGGNWSGNVGDSVKIGLVREGKRLDWDGIIEGEDGYGLRYTDVAIDGAPPIVALGTALGALRGLIVDYLWIKVNMMKEKGLFYEVMADADLITKLQPRFGEVWGFHGHNMAYNISVLTNTPEERWEWVKAGIDLVRKQGLRYNPNDVTLHKELAFWFAHKIDGVSDDAHLFYKRELAREWHFLLGEPPPDHAGRIAWMQTIAEAPETLDELYARVPATRALVEQLTADLGQFDRRFGFSLDREFLLAFGQWQAVKTSNYAKLLDLEKQLKRTDGESGTRLQNRLFQAFDRTFADPANQEAVDAFIAFLRKKVLRDAYNMDAKLMWQYTRDTGPIDWRHPAAHALFWSRRGGELASLRYALNDDISKIVNNDRTEIQAMQALARSGLMFVDPLSGENPTRLSDPRWIKVIDGYFTRLHDKFFDVPGGIPDSFTNFHENFMKAAVRELFRFGDYQGAQKIVDRLDRLYGSGGVIPNAEYEGALEDLVRKWTYGEYDDQPEIARIEVYAALRRGFREGLLMGDKKILEDALRFASEVTEYLKRHKYYDFVNKFGEGRMKDLIGDLENSAQAAFRDVLLDRTSSLVDRLMIFNRAGEAERRLVYDDVKAPLTAELAANQLSRTLKIEEVLPEPPGMEAYRAQLAAKRAAERKPTDNRDEAERK